MNILDSDYKNSENKVNNCLKISYELLIKPVLKSYLYKSFDDVTNLQGKVRHQNSQLFLNTSNATLEW